MKKICYVLMMSFLLIGATVFADDVSIDSDGNVETGVSNTDGNLEVTGASAEDAIFGSTSGTGAAGVYGINTTSNNYGILGYDSSGVYGNSSSGYAGYFEGNTRVTGDLTIDGNIASTTGIMNLNVSNPGPIIQGINSGNGYGVRGDNNSSGNQGRLGTTTEGVYGLSTNGFGMYGVSVNSMGVYGTDASGENLGYLGSSTGIGVYGMGTNQGIWGNSNTGIAGYFHSETGYGLIVNKGNVGLGTTTPAAQLDVNGAIRLGGGVREFEIFSVDGTETGWGDFLDYGGMGIGSTDGINRQLVLFTDGAGSNNIFTVATSQNSGSSWQADFVIQQDGKIGIGTTTPATKLQIQGGTDATFSNGSGYFVAGQESGLNLVIDNNEIMVRNNGSPGKLYLNNSGANVVVPVLEITGGADLSEQFKINNTIEENITPSPGMVVSIDPDNPGDLMVSNKVYDRRVAGIISGAGGVRTGMLMGQEGSEADGAIPVALTGRVYCNADASNGPIQPGDLLTTSDVKGHAMKVKDHSKAQGAIIGKAMSSLKEGKGLVLVLVSLQ